MAEYSTLYQTAGSKTTSSFGALSSLMPSDVKIVSMGGGITIAGDLTMSPSSKGNLSLLSQDSIIGIYKQINGFQWGTSTINISDASPSYLPGVKAPLSVSSSIGTEGFSFISSAPTYLDSAASSLFETSSYINENASLLGKTARHDPSILHAGDDQPVMIYSSSGSISDLSLFSPKMTQIIAGGMISNISFSIQNNSPNDVSLVSCIKDMILYDKNTDNRRVAIANLGINSPPSVLSGDIQISGPGALVVTAGGNIDLGNGPNYSDGTGVGITSIGNVRNPSLSFEGADIQLITGVTSPKLLGMDRILLSAASSTDSIRYFREVGDLLNQMGNNGLAEAFSKVSSWNDLISTDRFTDDVKSRIALVLFNVILRDAGRDHNNPNSSGYGSYEAGEQAITKLFGNDYKGTGSIKTWSRDIRTKNGGAITITAPGGGVTLANTAIGSSLTPPGIVTEYGGGINIFTRNNVDIGIGRIFTLRGGDIMIWSDKGDIAAGSSAKTVASAPPTRVIIDPQSASVITDLAGLATGGGIGVLATVRNAPVGNVDLIAPTGVIDAGDAGIRSSGNLNLAATKILNADNIAVAGISVGAPPAAAPASAPPPAAPPAAAPPAAASTAAAANNSAAETASKNNAASQDDATPSVFSIDIMGYGGGEGDDDDSRKKAADTAVAPVQASL
jgi:hypothetical protein